LNSSGESSSSSGESSSGTNSSPVCSLPLSSGLSSPNLDGARLDRPLRVIYDAVVFVVYAFPFAGEHGTGLLPCLL
jgi:hypothetical protein